MSKSSTKGKIKQAPIKEAPKVKVSTLPAGTLTEQGPGIWLARLFNPQKLNSEQLPGDWEEIRYINGFAEAKANVMHRRKMGLARFDRLTVKRQSKGKW